MFKNDEDRLFVRLGVAVVALAGCAGLVNYRASTNDLPVGGAMVAAAPLFIGILCGAFLRNRPVANACMLLAINLGVSSLAFGEGAICILMYSPLAFGIVALSAWITAVLRRNGERFTMLLLPLPFLAVGVERLHPPRADESVISSAAVIEQPPEAVWASLDRLQMPFSAEMPWILRELLPVPVAIHGGGTQPGAERRLTFQNGVVLARVTDSHAPDRFEVELSVEESGSEFFDHWVRLEHSSFLLERLPHGRTRITHSTRYRPRLHPRWYFAPIERRLAEVVQGYLLDAYARQIGNELVARVE